MFHVIFFSGHVGETPIKSECGELAGYKKCNQLRELNLNLFVKSLVSQNYNCVVSKELFELNHSGIPQWGWQCCSAYGEKQLKMTVAALEEQLFSLQSAHY